MAIFAWIGKRAINRYDKLEAEAVRRTELHAFRDDMRRERQSMHDENQRTLGTIKESVDETKEVATSTHARIDQLYRDLPNLARRR